MARAFTILRGGEPVALPYGPFTDDEGTQHSVSVLDLWNEADLAGIGVLATEVEDPRRLVRKSLVQERVNAIGKLSEAFAALNANPLAFGRWFAPDWPEVYFDDEGLLSILQSIGCTAEQIEVITAA